MNDEKTVTLPVISTGKTRVEPKFMLTKVKKPLISFIVPFYNRYEKTTQAIQSVLNSDFKNVEIILVDDASTETELEYFKAEALQHPNIIYTRQGKNLGPGAARNKGISLANGEWLFFLDSDDIIYPKALSDLAQAIERNSEADLVCIGNRIDTFSDRPPRQRISMPLLVPTTLSINELLNNFMIDAEFLFPLYHFLFRKQTILKHGLMMRNTYFYEDLFFIFEVMSHATTVLAFPTILYEYRSLTNGSLMANHNQNSDKLSNAISLFHEYTRYSYPEGLRKFITICAQSVYFSHFETIYANKNHCHLFDTIKSEISKSIYGIVDSVKKTVYITPCSPAGLILSEIIHNKNGVKPIFLDNNLTPETIAVSLCIKSGYEIIDTNKFANQRAKNTYTIIIFSTPAIVNGIAKQLENKGLMREENFVAITLPPIQSTCR
jgi:glycosyltransferase involved in cell wall biosynthesis